MTDIKQLAFAKTSDYLLKKNKKKLFLSLLATLLLVGAQPRTLLFIHTTSEPPHVTDKVFSHRDVIQLALNITYKYVQRNYLVVEKLLTRKGLSKRVKNALHDCLETIDDTLDDITKAKKDLEDYPSEKKSLYEYADDLKTLISSAITNQVTCLEEFSHQKSEKRFRELYLRKGQEHVQHLCSNALAMTKNLADTDIAIHEMERKLVEEDGIKWPEWISAADRRLLQTGTVTPDVVVAADGSGNYRTVSAAVDAAPERSSKRYVVRIKAGVYRENLDVPRTKTNIMFLGEDNSNTIITARNVVDGSTTFDSATVAVVGEGFLANGVTFQNAVGPLKHQAVALRVGADLSAFYLCGFIAIGATKDLQAVKGSFQSFLGRPWKEYSHIVIMQSSISDIIHLAGWFEWDGDFALNTLYYGEYHNTGAGADTSKRVSWKGFKVITSASEAQAFTPGNFIAVFSHRDVIQLALNITYRHVQRNYFVVEKLLTRKGLRKRVKTALHDCLETIDDTLDDINKAKKDLEDYPSENKSVYQHADDLKTLISSAMTNHVTCLDGFSHHKSEKRFREVYLRKGQEHAQHLCSNALAMIKNLSATDIAIHEMERKVLVEEEEDGIEWPEWISAEERRLLQTGTATPDMVVAADGSGNYTTVQAAVDAAPERSSTRYVIRIKAGVYRETVMVPKTKTNIMFLGDGNRNTIITASKNVVDGSTTFNSSTVAVVGDGFLGRGITFQNAAGPSKAQAVALRVGADLSAFYLCGFIAYQDTLYVHRKHQFFVKCYVAGTVDFIFGNSAVVLQDCDINARRPNPGQENTITAQGRADPNQNTGIVIQKCRINATNDLESAKGSFRTFLGRPWKVHSLTVIMQSNISDIIDPAGWLQWNGDFALNTLYYREYNNTGSGANTSHRVNWIGFKVITNASDVQPFTPQNFIAGSTWLDHDHVPFFVSHSKTQSSLPSLPLCLETIHTIMTKMKHLTKKKLLLALCATLLLVASGDNGSSPSHAIIKSACSSTLYPELCFSTIASEPGLAHKVSSHKNVIEVSLNITTGIVERNYFTIQKLLHRSLTKRQKTALHDCLETIDETLEELHKAMDDLKDYPSNSKKPLSQHADDLNTLISSAITNQETCLDGFSHDEADKRLRQHLEGGQVHVEHLCSNALAMTKNLTHADVAPHHNNTRKLMEADDDDRIKWPDWISAADRRLLQTGTLNPDLVVAADGTGDFTTVSAAVAAAPEKSTKRYVIKIKAGVYRENVDVPKKKTNIMFVGDGRTNTIITASRNVVDGSTTFNSATVAVVGERFLARDITFQNTAGPSKHQAVALRVGADLSAFYLCDFLAYQDTLYVHSNRQFFVKCYIAGTVDFIFGNSAAVLQDCDIHARRPNPGQKNMVTAQGRVDPNQNTGIVIHKSRIGATKDLESVKTSFPTFLGRPWKEYSRTVIMQSTISDVIDPAGWHEWNGNFALNTLFYGEYHNTGPGADTSRRVINWKGFKVITSAAEAQTFTPGNFIAGSGWLASTGFPFSLGL
ncbi:Pectinesterase 3 [Spatholobus suberectus]|nr:Pectinesterase 3 [Spatholobus suberectus]